jgi:hypothetical protein
VDDFLNQKIQVIGTPKTIGQAKITGSIIESIKDNPDTTLDKVAVVLGKKTFWFPLYIVSDIFS